MTAEALLFACPFTVVSVAVVAPESGREGDRVRGFAPDEVDVEFEVFVLSLKVLKGFRRPREPA